MTFLFSFFEHGFHQLFLITHGYLGSWSLTIVLLTIAFKMTSWPLQMMSTRQSKRLQAAQPAIKKIKEAHAQDPQRIQQETARLMTEKKINLLALFVPAILPIPLFLVFYETLKNLSVLLKDSWLLWIPVLSEPDPYFVLPLVVGLIVYVQGRLGQKPEDSEVQKNMRWLSPILMSFFSASMPAGIALYMLASSVTQLVFQLGVDRFTGMSS